MRRWCVRMAAGLVLAGATGGWAVGDPLFDDADAEVRLWDPFEPANRLTFRLNRGIDTAIIDPIVRAYAFVVPAPIRRGVRQALANLNSASTLVNDVLQLEPIDASVTLSRFLVNSTIGVVGFFDVAARWGLPGHHSDFGQTLALCGLPSGPYLIVPAIGPTTVRDGGGYVVDFFLRPATWLFTPATAIWFAGVSVQEGGTGIALREQHDLEMRALRASSLDYYAAFRGAWGQAREAQIWSRRQGRGPLARARRLLAAVCGPTPGGELGELGLDAHD